MPTPQELIGHIHPERVLDVATGTGGFVHFLVEGLPGFAEIIGIDANPRGEAAFAEAFKDKAGIHFEVMDALHLTFDSNSFDLVCMANSLHHFDDPLPALEEMLRVLRPGGYILLQEMYRDHQTETQLTHVELHHWWAAVDRASGVVHRETYLREELVKMMEGLGLAAIKFNDLSDTSDDPKAAEVQDQINPAIDRYIQRAEGQPELQAQGEQLRQRVKEVGVHGAASLLMIGEKHA